MNLKLLTKKHKSKIIILLYTIIIINITYFIFSKKIDQRKNDNFFNDYKLSIYIDKKDTLSNLETFLSLNNFKAIFNIEKIISEDRKKFESYNKKLINLLTENGFLFVNLEKGESLNSFYKIDLKFKDIVVGRDLEVNEEMIDKLKETILHLENKIILKGLNKLDFDFHFKYLQASYSEEERRLGEMEKYIKSNEFIYLSNRQDLALTQYRIMTDLERIMSDLEYKKGTFKQFVHIYNDLKKDTLHVQLRGQNLQESKTEQKSSRIADLYRLNILNVNIGGLLFGLLLILINEARGNYYQNLIGKKKNS